MSSDFMSRGDMKKIPPSRACIILLFLLDTLGTAENLAEDVDDAAASHRHHAIRMFRSKHGLSHTRACSVASKDLSAPEIQLECRARLEHRDQPPSSVDMNSQQAAPSPAGGRGAITGSMPLPSITATPPSCRFSPVSANPCYNQEPIQPHERTSCLRRRRRSSSSPPSNRRLPTRWTHPIPYLSARGHCPAPSRRRSASLPPAIYRRRCRRR